MSIDLSTLAEAPRVLIEVPLKPVQGTRFQPTGFPDLGAATFKSVQTNGENQAIEVDSLIVESAQSMANRLENVCWNEGAEDLEEPLQGLPYVRSTLPDGTITNSILESHRLNSPYIANSKEFEKIKEEIGFVKDQPFNRRKLAAALLKYDPSSLVHGVFLEKVGGVVRLPRMLSSFIEAHDIKVATSGGVKFDRVQPVSTEKGEEEKVKYGKAKEGFGNVPFHRDEYTGQITAYFNLDLTLLRGYGFNEAANRLLILYSLYKIQKFLQEGLRLRTACDLTTVGDVQVTQPEAFELPSLEKLKEALPESIAAVADQFVTPAVTDLQYQKK
ncbi:Type I-U CRISPR-associated protein Cas7 [Planctomycetales bacterium 10988]|nr:Type I-U CRISPR-associated protein Cas7 [Planctomycetales bacterium 10988]